MGNGYLRNGAFTTSDFSDGEFVDLMTQKFFFFFVGPKTTLSGMFQDVVSGGATEQRTRRSILEKERKGQ